VFDCLRAVRRTGHRYARQIDYRHLVENLKRKPGAFARWVFRDDIFPRTIYRQTWENLSAQLPERQACKTIVGLLALAADGHEAALALELEQLHAGNELPDLQTLTQRLAPRPSSIPCVCCNAADAGIVRRASGNGVMSGAQLNADGRLGLMLTELRLPTIKRLASELCDQSDRESWPARQLLERLLEQEMNERDVRRFERHRIASVLSPDKRLSSFDFSAVPTISHARITALTEGHEWLDRGVNLLAFGALAASNRSLTHE
jgi:IstB-like ATP binding protein